MLDERDLRSGHAGQQVKRYELARDRAQARVEEAETELRTAQAEFEVAQRELTAAMHVYNGAISDRKLPRVKPEKQRWLKALGRSSVIGTREMNLAAKETGWDPTPEALRALKKQYVDAGYMNDIGRGVVTLNRERIALGLGFDLFVDDDEPSPEDGPHLEQVFEESVKTERHEKRARFGASGDLDFLDDETPF